MNPMQNKTKEERQASAAKGHATRKANKEKEKAAREKASLERESLHIEIKALKKERDELVTHKLFSDAAIKLTNKFLLTEQEIVNKSTPLEFYCGIYFLIQNKQIIYVGQSINVFSRVAQHSNEKDFDSIAYISCNKDMLDKLESLYIHALRPRLNGQNKGVPVAPIMLDKLLAT